MNLPLDFYYTVQTVADLQQPYPSKSIGGYISETKIPNDDFGNIFNYSHYHRLRRRRQTRVLAIQNTQVQSISVNVSLDFFPPEDINQEDCECTYMKTLDIFNYYLGAGEVFFDDCDRPYLESMNNSTAKPRHTKLIKANPILKSEGDLEQLEGQYGDNIPIREKYTVPELFLENIVGGGFRGLFIVREFKKNCDINFQDNCDEDKGELIDCFNLFAEEVLS